MSAIEKNLDLDILNLCQKAKDLGASQAVPISAADIELDERAFLKCLVPICSHYGVDLMCPPNVMSVAQFRQILCRYHSAALVKVDIPSLELHSEDSIEKADYLKVAEESKKKLHEIVCRLESLCMERGYHFAAGLIGGSCPLCKECAGVSSGLGCRYPFKARPSMEALGIDVMSTVKKAGLRVSFGQNEGRSWIGMVLVD